MTSGEKDCLDRVKRYLKKAEKDLDTLRPNKQTEEEKMLDILTNVSESISIIDTIFSVSAKMEKYKVGMIEPEKLLEGRTKVLLKEIRFGFTNPDLAPPKKWLEAVFDKLKECGIEICEEFCKMGTSKL